MTERLVAGARTHGVRLHPDTPVTAVRRDAAGRVAGIETAKGALAGATVLAAGVATAALGASLGVRVPVAASPSPLFRLRAPAGLVRTVVNTVDFDLRQVAPDRLIAAADSPERTLAASTASIDDRALLSPLSPHRLYTIRSSAAAPPASSG